MNILVLDDERWDLFKLFLKRHAIPESSATFVKTAEECKKALLEKEYDQIYLDHDLGEETTCGSGKEVCHFIVDEGLQKNASIVIHSMNPGGADYMKSILEYGDYSVTRDPLVWSK